MHEQLPPAPPTHFRLSPESKAEVEKEYRSGRTARQIAAKWMISAGTVYRWACEGGWTKKKVGDEMARANAARMEAYEASLIERAREPNPEAEEEARAGRGPLIVESDCTGDSADSLAAAALGGVRRAFLQGRLSEAQSLAKTADMLTRVGERGPDSSLETIFRALTDVNYQGMLFNMIGDLDNPLKKAYWDWADGPEFNRKREQAKADREELERFRTEAAAAGGGG